MHVIILLLIIIAIIYLIIHWKISVPVILFLAYLSSIFARTNPIKNKFRFHALWWSFQLMLIGGIIYGEQVIDFMDDILTEYSHDYDRLVSRGISTIENDDYKRNMMLNDSLEAKDGKHIFGGLEVGMSPFEAICHIRDNKEIDNFHIGNIHFDWLRRSYYKNDLYGISMDFRDDEKYTDADSLVCFLKQKYGEPHLYIKDESTFRAEWHFNYKHIAIDCISRLKEGTLYIYQPDMLANKIADEAQKEQERMNKILKEQKELEEKQRQEELRLEEEQRQKEEKNRLLQNSL